MRVMEGSADVKHHPGYHAKFSLPTGRCFPKVHIKIADIARFRFSQHPYFYPPLRRFLGHVLSEEYSALEFDHCFIDTHIPRRDVMCQEVVMTHVYQRPQLVQGIVVGVASWCLLSRVLQMEVPVGIKCVMHGLEGFLLPLNLCCLPLPEKYYVCNATYAPPLVSDIVYSQSSPSSA